jgi:hypothetical protein
MPNTDSSATIGLPEDALCPVAVVAQQARVVVYSMDGAMTSPSKSAGNDMTQQRDTALYHRLLGLQDYATHLETKTALGAMFQIHQILYLAERIESWVPEDSERAFACEADLKAIERMVYSLSAFIETTTGANPDDACGEYYMPRDGNPHELAREKGDLS